MDFQNSHAQGTKSVSSRIGRCFLMESSCLHVKLFTVVYERPLIFLFIYLFFFSFFMPFTMSSQRKGGEKRKHTNLSIGARLELIKKLES